MADLENVQIHDFEYIAFDYMFVFCDPEDIDLEWVKRSVKVDYHYNNEFSPKELVKDIIRETQREK